MPPGTAQDHTVSVAGEESPVYRDRGGNWPEGVSELSIPTECPALWEPHPPSPAGYR